ncbi:MAG: polysaccharide deacetylase family protein, partial [Bacteroidales bacterium]|nr:polysaccharide deacetylase family protein [Bacteroidales bacterium]
NQIIEFNFKDTIYSYNCDNSKNKEIAFEKTHNFIKSIEIEDLKPFLKDLFRNYDTEEYVKSVVLNWDEIRQLSLTDIVTIGAHTISHNSLSKLTENESFNEISDSKKIIESKVGNKVNHFAYPYGSNDDFGEREINYCKDLGFKTATTTISANIVKKYYENQYRLPRIAVGMSMTEATLDLIRAGIIPMIRNKGKIFV